MKKLEFGGINKYKTKKSKHVFRWQALGEDMTTYYKQNCYWLSYKYTPNHLLATYNNQKKENDHNFQNLLYKLNMNDRDPQKIKEKIVEKWNNGEIGKAKIILEINKLRLSKEAYNYLSNIMV